MEIKITDKDMEFLRMAAEKSERSVENGGGPFGAVIVKNDEVLAVESNSVTIDNDPTAHAEVNAIRSACRKVGSFKLDGCYVYSSCEPCPMCLSALYWAGVERIYYGNTKEDADAATSLSMRNSNVRSRCAPFLVSMCLILAQSRHSVCGVTRPTK